jgi:hypothetical protein
VHLPQVDVVGPQPDQRALQRVEQPPAGGADAERPVAAPRSRFGGDDDVVTRAAVGQQPAEDALGLAAGVDVGGVDERAARLAEGAELGAGLGRLGVPPPRHRAEGEPGHGEAAAAQGSVLHERPP